MKMQNENVKSVIAMPSLTGALQGESLLQSSGIYARVIKLPAGAAKKGCAYGLELEQNRVYQAASILDGRRIKRGELLL